MKTIVKTLPLLIVLCYCSVEKKDRAVHPAVPGHFSIPALPPDEGTLKQLIADLETNAESAVLHRRLGIAYFKLSYPDRWDYITHAIEHLEVAARLQPNLPETTIYLGLSQAINARKPGLSLLARLGSARGGFQLMDQAVGLAPDNFSVRLLRAKADLAAPPMLGRRDLLKEGWLWISDQLANPDALSADLRARGYLFLGDHADRIMKDRDQARRHWQRAAELAKGLPLAEKARSRYMGSSSNQP